MASSDDMDKATGKKSLARSALEMALGRGAVAVVSIGFLAYFARELDKPILGILGIELALVKLIKILADLGLHYQVVKEATPLILDGNEAQAVREIIGPATLVRVTVAIGVCGLLYGAGYVFMTPLDAATPGMSMQLGLGFAVGHILLKTSQYILSPIFFARHQFWLDAMLDSGSTTIERLAALGAYLWLGVDFLFAGMFLGQAIVLCTALFLLRSSLRHVRLRQLRWFDARHRLREYFPHFQRVFYREGFRGLDRITVGILVPLESMAAYHVARQGTVYLRKAVRLFADPLTVRLANDTSPEKRAKDRRTFLIGACTPPVLVTLASPWLMQALGGEAYAESWHLMAVLALSYVFYALSEYQLAVVAILGGRDAPIRFEGVAAVLGISTTIALVLLVGEAGIPFGQLMNFVLLWWGGRVITREVLQGLNRPLSGSER